MITIGFYFLLRPGEHTAPTADATPFCLQDVEFLIGHQRYTGLTIPLALLPLVTFVLLVFTTQKNGVRGEKIGHGRSGHARFCSVEAVCARVRHLRDNNAPGDTPLCTYYVNTGARFVTSADITTTLRASAAIIGPASLGFEPAEISARSLRASGAMALLCARVDSDTIRLLGRWRSDEMLRYLHVQAQPLMQKFAAQMLQGGHYSFVPAAAAVLAI
jgi:hypothetical protein